MRGKIVFTEEQRNFLLSPVAKALKPADASRLKKDEAFERFTEVRFGWQGGHPECPTCGAERPYVLHRTGLTPHFRCRKGCGDFSLTSGTIFASRKAPLGTLLHAISLRIHEPTNALQASYQLGVHYKTAWSWFKQLRVLLGNVKSVRTQDNRWPFLNGDRDEASALIAAVNGALPRSLPEQIRADVAQDMIVGVLSGDISESDLETQVRKYLRKHYKNVETPYLAISLNQPVPGTDGMSWNNRLASDVVRA